MTLFIEIAGWTLIHFVWQGAAIGLATAGALKAAARRSPNLRYVIACAGLALMLAAPAATARLLLNDRVTGPHAVISERQAPANASVATPADDRSTTRKTTEVARDERSASERTIVGAAL